MRDFFARDASRFSLLVTTALFITSCTQPTPSSQSASPDTPSSDSVRFSDITREAGLDEFSHETGAFGKKWFPETVGAGGGFLDYNGDGWLDILLVGGGVWEQSPEEDVKSLWLYKNNGDGTFTEVTSQAGLADVSVYGFGVSAADYDNDGDEDFLLTTLHENKLFRNDGGVFTEVGAKAGLADRDEWSTSAMFFDADNDGHLDLYIGNYVDWSPENDIFCTLDGETKEYCTPDFYDGIPGRYYHNNGDGTFTDRTEEAGFLPAPGNSFGVAAIDYNHDGWTDVAIANDMQRNLLYENNGDGTFTEKGTISGIAYGEDGKARAGMGIDVGYIDQSGQPSIIVGNFTSEMIGVFQHTENDLFIDRAAVSRIGDRTLRTLTFGLFLFDVDLDGDLDLFAANGHIKPGLQHVQNDITYRQRPQLFLNNGTGTFRELNPSSGVLTERMVARGTSYGDIDRDGDQDILITENGGGAHLWQNDGSENHYLRLKLQGRESNTDGIGARIEAVIDDTRLTRFVRTGSSYLSQSEKNITLGLGQASRVDTLTVHWPSGQSNQYIDIPADQNLKIIEGSPTVQSIATASSWGQ